MMFELCIDLENELSRLLGLFEILIPSSVHNEIKMLSVKGNGRRAQYARAALNLIKKYSIFPDDTKPVDDSIIKIALKINAFVLTNDKALHQRLKEKQINVIYLRSKHTLQMDSKQ
jgi:rRNA-processing protein FCF1